MCCSLLVGWYHKGSHLSVGLSIYCARLKTLPPRVCLSKESRSYILWWLHFAQVSNGSSLSSLSHLAIPSAIFSDASGSLGCGLVWGTWWFQGQWPQEWSGLNIMIKELVTVVVAAAMWGCHWSFQHVHFHIDNASLAVPLILLRISSIFILSHSYPKSM